MLRVTRALVIGYGSIGARHARVLADDLDADVAVVSRRPDATPRSFTDVRAAVADYRPDYVVVATETTRHAENLKALDSAGYEGPILVEKPLFGTLAEAYRPASERIAVAFNLRFNPVIRALRDIVSREGCLTFSVHVGQWLPAWRPGRDYAETASARRANGGGVLRDLSHELDYVTWLLGGWRRVAGLGGKVSELAIDTEDAVALLLECVECSIVQIHLDYLDRRGERRIKVNTRRASYIADVLAGSLIRDDEEVKVFDASLAETYPAEHRAVFELDETLCSYDEGLEVVALVEAAERALAESRWVGRGELSE